MKCKICFAVVGIAAITTSIALAQNSKDAPTPASVSAIDTVTTIPMSKEA